jgi:AcrR family transcriptional regulator
VTTTRERLLAAAQQVTESGGYGAASVVAIAEQAGVAAGTLYRHFPSKADLFAELFRAVCDREAAAMEAEDDVEAVLVTFAERALRNPRLAWALIAEPVDPLVDAERLAYRERYARHLAGLLEAGIAAGTLPPQPVELTAAALVGGVAEALVGPLAPTGRRRPELLDDLRSFVRRAIGA